MDDKHLHTMTDKELARHVYASEDATPLERELAKRLEDKIYTPRHYDPTSYK